MSQYFATFPPGFSVVVKQYLRKCISQCEVIEPFESSIIFKTETSIPNLIAIPFVTNIFMVISFQEINLEKQSGALVKQLMRSASLSEKMQQIEQEYPDFRTFRIMVQRGSKLVSIPSYFVQRVSSFIERKTNFLSKPEGADAEFWFLLRGEKVGIFGFKLPLRKEKYKTHKGQLRPKLAHLLNLLADPSDSDIYLDPYAGYGSLCLDLVSYFPYKKIYNIDIDDEQVRFLKKRFGRYKNVIVRKGDALNLSFPDKSIDVIVTDPPWGLYQMQKQNYSIFYTKMLREFARILKVGGRVVILTARKEEFVRAVQNSPFVVKHQIDTLVNGKKAGVYLL